MWWQRGVIYEVYPRSFADGNGDGEGDLPGLRARLDYLVDLGVDAVWIAPIFVSPMVDGGYDVADYAAIDPRFGSLADFDHLIADAHRRNLRVICDFVPNHTSIQHPWFVASRRSRGDPKRDWYLWRDPAPGGGPPNNWVSEFGGSAWTLDPASGQYYYHAFAPEQPDLNWRNPGLREAMYDVLRFWLDRGVDGFRVDVMWHLIKDARFRDNPPNPDYVQGVGSPYRRLLPVYSADQPENHEVVAQMRAVLDEYAERVMIGELYLPIDRLVTYYGDGGRGAHLPFNFHLISTPWTAGEIGALVDRYEAALPAGAWPNWVLGNHDQPRVASRLGEAQARVAAMLLLTLRGTPTLYYGDELGMHDVAIPLDAIVDVRGRGLPGRDDLSRDGFRTPMAWDASPAGGFSNGRPWLPPAPDHATRNVAVERTDPGSMLSLYRRLLSLRRAEPALSVGGYRPLPVATEDLLAYRRYHDGRQLLVVLNLGSRPTRCQLPPDMAAVRILLRCASGDAGEVIRGELAIPGDDGLVAEVIDSQAGGG